MQRGESKRGENRFKKLLNKNTEKEPISNQQREQKRGSFSREKKMKQNKIKPMSIEGEGRKMERDKEQKRVRETAEMKKYREPNKNNLKKKNPYA